MRELRHDFRHHYHVSYEDVPTGEAIDLIGMLPDGSRYVSATDPTRAWDRSRHNAADVVDAILLLAWAMAYDHEKMPEPPRAVRPRDVAIRREQRERARHAREVLEGTKWVEV